MDYPVTVSKRDGQKLVTTPGSMPDDRNGKPGKATAAEMERLYGKARGMLLANTDNLLEADVPSPGAGLPPPGHRLCLKQTWPPAVGPSSPGAGTQARETGVSSPGAKPTIHIYPEVWSSASAGVAPEAPHHLAAINKRHLRHPRPLCTPAGQPYVLGIVDLILLLSLFYLCGVYKLYDKPLARIAIVH